MPETFSTPLAKKLRAKHGAEVVVFFTTRRAGLERRFAALKKTLAPADGLWIAWPKKASKIETDLDFTTVQEIGLAAGLVDNKSAAIEARVFGSRFWAQESPAVQRGPVNRPTWAIGQQATRRTRAKLRTAGRRSSQPSGKPAASSASCASRLALNSLPSTIATA